MQETYIKIKDYNIKIHSLNTVVVGSGAAGFNAADRLYQYGQKDIAIVTEGINEGTSRNTGSDKQTYYKLTLSGGEPDSVEEMAKTLFEGQCMDGDIALCEAALSAQSFLKLVEIGVPFPKNRYGEFIGYKTDHDPRRRATSVGPYTSKMMTECLEKSVKEKGIKIFDRLQVIKILTDNKKLYGLLCIDLNNLDIKDKRFVVFNCKNLVYATGGPAGIYKNSVYPLGHYGGTGMAFEAGVLGRNLTEWQYGMASIKPRWNVSGTYMQVLPKFISTNAEGGDEREFLSDFFTDKGEMLTKIFLKGYQWPFDVRKVDGGSSIIDILVYMETCKDRKVYLDFRKNPDDTSIDFDTLSSEAKEYLGNAKACFGTPIDRLLHMNKPAVDFYKDKGVDLTKERLEIALCAQHNNGGLAIDCWWQTNINGFFAAGEVSASHGVYRPGGSALNAGQVGSTRAAQYIAARRQGDAAAINIFKENMAFKIEECINISHTVINNTKNRTANVNSLLDYTATLMSRFGAAIRNKSGIETAIGEVKKILENFTQTVAIESVSQLYLAYRLYDTLISQYLYLGAMKNYIESGGRSRGSSLYTDLTGKKPHNSFSDIFKYNLDEGQGKNKIQEGQYICASTSFKWRDVKAIPKEDDFFENVWRAFREDGNIH
ncbi:MAG: FAD-binding protein [Clostridia bacterium]